MRLDQILNEPLLGLTGDFLERAGLGKEVRRTGNDRQSAQAFHAFVRLAIELEHLPVAAADDEQGGCRHERQRPLSEIRAPPARHNGTDRLGCLRRRQKCGTGSGARAEVSEPQVGGLGRADEPLGRSS